jgi:(1->4)-alpha-D-glucan 1-alpha-D-glucosylmutase
VTLLRIPGETMNVPKATYRIQFSRDFGFRNAEALVPYLSDLGISHLYASPIFKARKGSSHGYDITDPNTLNPELGTLREFESLMQTVGCSGMGWIQDIVPNHMAYDPRNDVLMDVLERGPGSSCRKFFDIDWESPCEGLGGRVLAPFLGRPYADCLESGEIKVVMGETGLVVAYQGLRFPLRPDSYGRVLGPVPGRIPERTDGSGLADLRRLLRTLSDSGVEPVGTDDLQRLKHSLWSLYRADREIRRLIDGRLDEVNGLPGIPGTFDLLDEVLSGQFYRLAHWKVAAEMVNYRRFFDINHLIVVRVEEAEVYRNTHDLLERLVSRGWITGLRVDHVDGLYDPSGYLERLRQSFPGLYVVVEKILDHGEEMPRSWPVQGTTGYEFLNAVNGLFVKKENEGAIDRLYRRFTGWTGTYGELLAEKKELVLERLFEADLKRLTRLTERVAHGTRRGRDLTAGRLRESLVRILEAFPVYRTYVALSVIRDADVRYIRGALEQARRRMPGHREEIDFIGALLLNERHGHPDAPLSNNAMEWRMRFQQITAPLTAKGFEDTLLYVFNRLMSLNEVGGSPDRFGYSPEEFHDFLRERNRRWPHGLNATATHDTKRGEDHRARISVLSEIPGSWTRQIRHWSRLNRRKKSINGGDPAPDRNLEYLIYQTLVGALPPEGVTPSFRERMKNYVVKAAREARVHTSWTDPDEGYEAACLRFLESILNPGEGTRFIDALERFHARVAWYGMLNALSQALVKIASPGVPDFYQGTELWDFSLVDPDNRRPVDFDLRRRVLAEIRERFDEDPASLVDELLRTMGDGRVKMFLIWRALAARRDCAGLFRDGELVPLAARGRYRKHVIAFARCSGTAWALAVAPRLLARLVKKGDLPLGAAVWEDTATGRLEGMPAVWKDALTGEEKRFEGNFPLGELLARFPAALLLGNEGHP